MGPRGGAEAAPLPRRERSDKKKMHYVHFRERSGRLSNRPPWLQGRTELCEKKKNYERAWPDRASGTFGTPSFHPISQTAAFIMANWPDSLRPASGEASSVHTIESGNTTARTIRACPGKQPARERGNLKKGEALWLAWRRWGAGAHGGGPQNVFAPLGFTRGQFSGFKVSSGIQKGTPLLFPKLLSMGNWP